MSYHQQQRLNWKFVVQVLEKLHQTTNSQYGYHRDSFYGKRRLKNGWWDNWWDFFRQTRLHPLICDLHERGDFQEACILSFIGENLEHFGTPTKPCLVHGDLWANNLLFDGKNTLAIDPVCFFGDPLLDYAKFSNKKSGLGRTMFYHLFFMIDFYLFTGERKQDPVLKKVIKFLCSQKPLNIHSLIYRGRDVFEPIQDHETPESCKHVLLCFGAFNPPHPNHIQLILKGHQYLQSQDPESTFQCFFIAAPSYYIQSKQPTIEFTYQDRLDLLLSRFKEQSPSLASPKASVFIFTVSHNATIQLLRSQFPTAQFTVCLGSDSFDKSQTLITEPNVHFLVFRRNGFELDKDKLNGLNVKFITYVDEKEQQEWSSTMIRQDPVLLKKYSSK